MLDARVELQAYISTIEAEKAVASSLTPFVLCKAQISPELASCIVLEKQSLIIVDSDFMDMQIRK